MKSTTHNDFPAFIKDVIVWNIQGGFGLQLYRGLLILGMATGIYA